MNFEKMQPPRNVSSVRRLRASTVRAQAWEESRPLIKQRRWGAAYRRMINACHQAWRIECCKEP